MITECLPYIWPGQNCCTIITRTLDSTSNDCSMPSAKGAGQNCCTILTRIMNTN